MKYSTLLRRHHLHISGSGSGVWVNVKCNGRTGLTKTLAGYRERARHLLSPSSLHVQAYTVSLRERIFSVPTRSSHSLGRV